MVPQENNSRFSGGPAEKVTASVAGERNIVPTANVELVLQQFLGRKNFSTKSQIIQAAQSDKITIPLFNPGIQPEFYLVNLFLGRNRLVEPMHFILGKNELNLALGFMHGDRLLYTGSVRRISQVRAGVLTPSSECLQALRGTRSVTVSMAAF